MNFSISDLAGEHTAITAMKTATAKWRYETELHSIEGLQERRPNAPAGGRSGFANWSRQRARWFKCSSLAKARPSHELRTEPYRRLSAKPISEPSRAHCDQSDGAAGLCLRPRRRDFHVRGTFATNPGHVFGETTLPLPTSADRGRGGRKFPRLEPRGVRAA